MTYGDEEVVIEIKKIIDPVDTSDPEQFQQGSASADISMAHEIRRHLMNLANPVPREEEMLFRVSSSGDAM